MSGVDVVLTLCCVSLAVTALRFQGRYRKLCEAVTDHWQATPTPKQTEADRALYQHIEWMAENGAMRKS